MRWTLGALILCAGSLMGAGGSLRVDEPASKVTLQGERSAVSLALHNSDSRPVTARLKLDWLNTADEVTGSVQRELSIPPGASNPLTVFPLPRDVDDEKTWYRLRYSLSSEGGEIGGMLSLARLAAHAFNLSISSSRTAPPGKHHRVLVHARHPVSNRPVPGVQVRGELGLMDDPVRTDGVTDATGDVELDFPIPTDVVDTDVYIEVEGELGDFEQSALLEVVIDRGTTIRIDTDKPLYQPGQTLRIRLLCLVGDGAAADQPVDLRIQDPERLAVFRSTLKTNRFGIAAVEWQIPENVRLGDYDILASGPQEESDWKATWRTIRVSRYELPNFSVTAKADREYYLPGQNAEVELRADYLFGEPVVNGHVRVVRELSREWDYQTQEWVIDEEESIEFEAGDSGRGIARLDLSEAHAELHANERRFQDLTYTAYVRDPTSGRTEQRQFDLRVTRDPIHVYLITPHRRQETYVSTSGADGSPVSCDVTVNGTLHVRTNRYGLAQVDLPEEVSSVVIDAEDGSGRRGHLEQEVHGHGSMDIDLTTDKTLYRPGEPILAELTSSQPVPLVALQVVREDRILDSQWIDLSAGHAQVEIPWREEFVHEIAIGAVVDSYGDFAVRAVLFPSDRELSVGVHFDRVVYRPGEEAVASFAVRTPDGEPVEAALGVAVVDAAVGERTRMDSESGGLGPFASWRRYHRADDELAGVKIEDLYRLDCSQPFPMDLDLLAKVMLSRHSYWPNVETSVDYLDEMHYSFRELMGNQFQPIRLHLDARFQTDYHYPKDAVGLEHDLSEAGISLAAIRDPWDRPYHVSFETRGGLDRVLFVSEGPDQLHGTADDLTAATFAYRYFKPELDRIRFALQILPAFPSSERAARERLLSAGIDVAKLRDPWGAAYRLQFRVRGALGILDFVSAGPDQVFGTTDDVHHGEVSGRYLKEMEDRLSLVIRDAEPFPESDEQWDELMRTEGISPLTDVWENSLYTIFAHVSHYGNLQRFYTEAKYGGGSQSRVELIPVTNHSVTIRLRSPGRDRVKGTPDDFTVAVFEKTRKVDEAESRTASGHCGAAASVADAGSIVGVVVDASGAVVPGATVRARRNDETEVECESEADSFGHFLLAGLAAGSYRLRIESAGFQLFIMRHVPVEPNRATVVDATLRLGAVTETVTVHGEGVPLQTESAQVAVVEGDRTGTPRLRQYFPETLLWAPMIETGEDGRARLRFPLADNITTWKLEVIGSTLDGKIGVAAADVRVFQPFFADYSPPTTLTVGDEVHLPVSLRNYLGQPQEVETSMKAEEWFRLLDGASRSMRVASGATTNTVFPIRVTTVIDGGKSRVTAVSPAAGDAIEKPVSVHPDGNEIIVTRSRLMREEGELELSIPASAIAGSARGELKIYPNLLSHVIDGIEGILRRPYGCAEQTISAAYPNLMLLSYLRRTGRESPFAARARGNLQTGLDKLTGYRGEDGGFSYWGKDESDVVLTAYALTFLTEASKLAVVENEVLQGARACLVERQAEGGEWKAFNWKQEPDQRRTLHQTIAAALALATEPTSEPVTQALAYLRKHALQMDDSYTIASIALLAQSVGDKRLAGESYARLRRLTRREGGLAYWHTGANTPFHGWGLAGRLETTALAVRALSASRAVEDGELANSGLAFLLRNKDRFGVWWSTQATVRVLEAILNSTAASDNNAGGPVEVSVNGRRATTVALPSADELTGPLIVDLSSYLAPGANRVEVQRAGGGSLTQAHLAASYYVPWTEEPRQPDQYSLRLRVSFDKTALHVGEDVRCSVTAERTGFRGYGMMLGEIGLPPGVEVDRASLDAAITETDYSLNRYDVLPDRLIVYLSPRAGGASFSFLIRPRMAMRAKTGPSRLYDYYNPESQAVVAPVLFEVDPAPKVHANVRGATTP